MSGYKELKSKRVLVTGGTQGIGEAIVASFSNEKCKVAANGRKINEKVQNVLDQTGSIAAIGDIGNVALAKEMIHEVEVKLGGLDILVCNAAGMSMNPFLEHDEEQWWSQININLTGHIACIQAALPIMKKKRRRNNHYRELIFWKYGLEKCHWLWSF